MKKILHDLYHGRIPGWDSVASTTKNEETRQKMLSERRYFASYRFQFKSYLPIAAKRGKALAPRFPQPLCQIGLNLESVSIMSAEDFERFKALEALHYECHTRRYRNTYTNAFKLGVMLMCAVFMNDDEED